MVTATKWFKLLSKGLLTALDTIKNLNSQRADVLQSLGELAPLKEKGRKKFTAEIEEYLSCLGTDKDEQKENRKTLRGLLARLSRGTKSFSQLTNRRDILSYSEEIPEQKIPLIGVGNPIGLMNELANTYGAKIPALRRLLSMEAKTCMSYLENPRSEEDFFSTLTELRERERELFDPSETKRITDLNMDMYERMKYRRSISKGGIDRFKMPLDVYALGIAGILGTITTAAIGIWIAIISITTDEPLTFQNAMRFILSESFAAFVTCWGYVASKRAISTMKADIRLRKYDKESAEKIEMAEKLVTSIKDTLRNSV